eukprot:TRINITY_DN4323_c0_g1_i2.p1 TRINITY_DN4323_c0_g1~~TRINITY_DN4323_c0_g1_i2.p1  ORF type:complete len:291 (-),score=97.47 TRINITY_DN4323_c0_g1_i2:133-1005(-)
MSQAAPLSQEFVEGSQGDLTKKDLEKILSDVVFYLLTQESKRHPIKRNDLFKACNLQNKSKWIKEQILVEARTQLSDIFGFRLQEMNPKRGSSGIQYILLNEKTEDLKSPEESYLSWSDKENGRIGLLFTILGLIFMSPDGVIEEATLNSFLRRLCVYDDEDSSSGRPKGRPEASNLDPEIVDLFGNVKDLIHKEWGSKMHYLDINALPPREGDSATRHEYRWGERAEVEVRKSHVLSNICMMYGVPPSYFNEQRSRILEGEDERDKAILRDYEASLEDSKEDEEDEEEG